MISDVLSDAVGDIEQYLADDPDYDYADEIRRVCVVMDRMRGLLDDRAPSEAKEWALRRIVPTQTLLDRTAELEGVERYLASPSGAVPVTTA